MGQFQSSPDHDQETFTALTNETGFSSKEIQNIHKRYKQLDKDEKGYLTRADFLRIAELTINPIGDRIVHLFFIESQSEMVTFRDFVRILARFRPMDTSGQGLNSEEEKLRFIFRLYDLDGDNIITGDELFDLLMLLTSETIPANEMHGIVQQSISEAVDSNIDNNKITFQDFYKVMKEEHVADKMSFKFSKGT